MAGIPLGLMLLKAGAESVVKGVLATLIIAFSTYSLFGGKHRRLSWFAPRVVAATFSRDFARILSSREPRGVVRLLACRFVDARG
jgi:hypothetical protein